MKLLLIISFAIAFCLSARSQNVSPQNYEDSVKLVKKHFSTLDMDQLLLQQIRFKEKELIKSYKFNREVLLFLEQRIKVLKDEK